MKSLQSTIIRYTKNITTQKPHPHQANQSQYVNKCKAKTTRKEQVLAITK